MPATAMGIRLIPEWGYHLWNSAAESPVTISDVESVHDEVLAKLDRNFFLMRYDCLTPKDKEYLAAMTELGPGLIGREISRAGWA
ncbi:hypothetical protein [Salana multivorans]